MSKNGFVFVLTNKFMSDIVVIGYSYKRPEKLAYAISRSTGVPVDFNVSLIKKTSHPVDDFKKIKESLENIVKDRGNVVMVECHPEKILKSMKSDFGFSSGKNNKTSLFIAFVFVALLLFLFSWYYNFLGLK